MYCTTIKIFECNIYIRFKHNVTNTYESTALKNGNLTNILQAACVFLSNEFLVPRQPLSAPCSLNLVSLNCMFSLLLA